MSLGTSDGNEKILLWRNKHTAAKTHTLAKGISPAKSTRAVGGRVKLARRKKMDLLIF
jgi:hypothetical protein